MTRHDYRVTVSIEFTVDVGARDAYDAEQFALQMTRQVFKEDYSRAEIVRMTIPYDPIRLDKGDPLS